MLDKTEQLVTFIDPGTVPDRVSDEELENLGPGCYVQVKDNENCLWVEIKSVEGDFLSGVVHCELGGSVCSTSQENLSEVTFHKNQIVDLGCDNYCWC